MDKFSDLFSGILDMFIILKVDFIIFKCPKPAFYGYVVCLSTFTIHADFTLVIDNEINIFMACKLAALIGI